MGLRVGIADHLGWAVAVTADGHGHVVDRRRLELVGPGVPNMPIHHESKSLDVEATEALVAQVRASVVEATAAALEELETELTEPVEVLAMRHLPDDFPTDIATQMAVPWEARADAVMYRSVMGEVAASRGWRVVTYDAKTVIADAVEILGPDADEILQSPKARLGPPWTKDHRLALAATLLVG